MASTHDPPAPAPGKLRPRARAREWLTDVFATLSAREGEPADQRVYLEDPWPWTPSTGAALGGSRKPNWAAAWVEARLLVLARRDTAFDSVRELNRLADPGPRRSR